MELFSFLEPEFLIKTFGVLGLFVIVFAESGLFFGFFLPGDSLLFTAGFLAHFIGVNIYLLTAGVILMAILGDSFGYWFGKKVGYKLFQKEDSLFFKKKYLIRAKIFFEKHGARSIFLARFIPIVRTFTPILAGSAEMKYKTFLKFNILGGFFWGGLLTLSGYFLGELVPNSEKYVTYIIIAIILTSFIPVVWELLKGRKK